MKTLFLSLALLSSHLSYAGDLSLSASSLKLKVYKFAVSTSPLCTNLSTVVDNGTTPQEVNFVGGISLGFGTIATGNYPCIVIEFSDQIKYKPDQNSTSGNCLASTEYTLDVCSSGSAKLIDGTTTNCDGTDNKVAMYLSTGVASNGDGFYPPTVLNDTTNGFVLGSQLSITGTSSGSFVVNPTGKVCDDATSGCDGGSGGGSNCKMEVPAFSFSH